MGSIRILFLLVQVIAQITFAPRSSAYQLSSPSNQPKSSAEEPSLKPVVTVPNPAVACRRQSEESPKAHAKRNLDPEFEGCTICLQPWDEGQIDTSLPCNHQFHKNCLDKWRARRQESATCPLCRKLLPKPAAESSDNLGSCPNCFYDKLQWTRQLNPRPYCPRCFRVII